jgi:hypothetical protein
MAISTPQRPTTAPSRPAAVVREALRRHKLCLQLHLLTHSSDDGPVLASVRAQLDAIQEFEAQEATS